MVGTAFSLVNPARTPTVPASKATRAHAAGPAAATASPLVALAGRYDLDGTVTGFRPLSEGLMTRNWRITTTAGDWFLKHYLDAGPRQIAFQHQVTAALAEARLPVPTPLPAPSGRKPVTAKGRHFALYPWVAGRHRRGLELPPEGCAALGRLLGRLHTELGRILPPIQQPLLVPTASVARTLARIDELLALVRAQAQSRRLRRAGRAAAAGAPRVAGRAGGLAATGGGGAAGRLRPWRLPRPQPAVCRPGAEWGAGGDLGLGPVGGAALHQRAGPRRDLAVRLRRRAGSGSCARAGVRGRLPRGVPVAWRGGDPLGGAPAVVGAAVRLLDAGVALPARRPELRPPVCGRGGAGGVVDRPPRAGLGRLRRTVGGPQRVPQDDPWLADRHGGLVEQALEP